MREADGGGSRPVGDTGPVIDTSDRTTAASPLQVAIVVQAGEETCTAIVRDQPMVVPYAAPFPRPRTGRVFPGHLVAIAGPPDQPPVVVWRWFDAVVLEAAAGQVRLWEPNHGEVLARARDVGRVYRPGSRAYLSSGLDGAEWWVAGTAVVHPHHAEVELEEVRRFLVEHGMWGGS